MKRFYFLAGLLATLQTFGQQPAGLRCEHLVNPLGIDAAQPRFTWRILSGTESSSQVTVSRGGNTVWESPKVSNGAGFMRYNGPALAPFTGYEWKVTVWDGGQSASATARFETGMLGQRAWKGAWISDVNDVDLKPAALFRKSFRAGGKVRSARAYIAAAGLYELYVNGHRIGEHRLDPMYTRFDRRNLYVTWDVTREMQSGENVLGVMLGNGWYNHQSTAVWDFHKAPWRARPAFCMDVRITYDDGRVETISTGKDWKTATGPVIFNSIYTAEHYDARLEKEGWANHGFDDQGWKHVLLRAAPSMNVTAQAMVPVVANDTLPAKDFRKFSSQRYLYDLGRNISGVSKITVKGPAGTVLRLRHAERLDSAGHADQSNIDVHYRPTDDQDPFQTDIFILSGKGEETFMPRFNYKGFQFVEVESSQPVELKKESLTGYFLHSQVAPKGFVRTSNPVMNRIWEATNNSYLSNLFGYPTDCPQREKNGWTGDAHQAIETALYNFDGITVYEKWLNDHFDEQQPNGVFPSIIPTGGWGYEWGNGPDWTSTIAIIPWNIYLFYGDTTLLARSYDAMRRYIDHITEISPSGITTWGLGDWIPVKSKTPVPFTSTAFYFTDVTILAKTAKLLGKTDDHTQYSALADRIRNAFNEKYLNAATGIYGQGVQTEMSVALYMGLVPDSLRAKVAANLYKRVEADNFHLDVGLIGSKSILNALSENGYADAAYRIASQEDYPSWGWWIKNGATTLYENWPINAKSDISLNHIMFGEIGAWLYKGIGGIFPDERSPGFRHVRMVPHFVKGLDQFECHHDGPNGRIISSWVRKGKTVTYTMTIPPNSTATLQLPGRPLVTAGAGKHTYEIKD
ncbi:alpha-L-rhamnosidase [Chitinophaga caseinilytica]|uniref:alpha-L-rhamnosidase n=1 Tax=Chitinophaga caseinilytica TaxID=2267521 RepID=A0ABZ2Z112_9BACT